jgi:hypothetical protein
MEFSEFLTYCRHDIQSSARYSRLFPIVCRLTINLNFPWAVVAGMVGGFTQNFGLGLCGVGVLGVLRWLKKSPLLQAPPAGRLDALPDITEDLDPGDKEVITAICRRCGIDPAKVRVRSNLASNAIAPSVCHIGAEYHLILPTGFFGLWQRQPKAAIAMIAHEMGHILQADVDLYIVFQRYMRFMLEKFIPTIFLSVLVVTLVDIEGLVLMASNLGLLQANAFGGVGGVGQVSEYYQAREAAVIPALMILLSLFFAVLTVLLSLLLALVFRVLNRRSEVVCDRIALALTSNDGIRTALNLPEFQHIGRSPFFTPSLPWRQRKLNRTLALLKWQDGASTWPSAEPVSGQAANIASETKNIFAAPT